MCLGIPAKIIEIEQGSHGKIETGGIHRKINLSLIKDARVGDWVIVHAGFAITKMDEKEAMETLKLLKEMTGSV